MLNSITVTIMASTAVLAKAYPHALPYPYSDPHDGYYRYIGYDWPVNSRYYYPQKGFYYHYLPPDVEYPNPKGDPKPKGDGRSEALTKNDEITFPAEKFSDVVDIADEGMSHFILEFFFQCLIKFS